jgi:hypothetical protein
MLLKLALEVEDHREVEVPMVFLRPRVLPPLLLVCSLLNRIRNDPMIHTRERRHSAAAVLCEGLLVDSSVE